jgi:DNA-directed RNA polymerase subunit omega
MEGSPKKVFMKNEFVRDALKTVVSPQILVNIVSRRVRQLGQGFRPLVEVHPRWTFMDIALKEISDGKLTYEALEPEFAPVTKKKKKSRA